MLKENVIVRQEFEAVLAKAADDVEVRTAAFFDDPNDPESIHKLRVSIRTLRSLVAFAAPWQKSKQNRIADRCLRDIVRETSRLRELDVLEAQERALDPLPAEDLLDAIANAAREERNRVYATLHDEKVRKLFARARAATRAISWRNAVAREGMTRVNIQKRFDEFVREQDERYEALDLYDVEETHDVRKRAKEARYVATKFSDFLHPDAEDVAKRMKAVQDELGALCDARINVDLLSSFPLDGLSAHACRNVAEALAANYALIEEMLPARVTEPVAGEGDLQESTDL